MAMPVNCFVTDPIRNLVAGSLGMPAAASAAPYPLAEQDVVATSDEDRSPELVEAAVDEGAFQ